MKKDVTMLEVLGHEDSYYIEEYQRTWKRDLALLERIMESCNEEEIGRIYDMINGETYEIMHMIEYIAKNKYKIN